MSKKKAVLPLERVAVVPCDQGTRCWCRMLVYESYLKNKRCKGKVIIGSGEAHKDDVERIAELINRAYDIVKGREGNPERTNP